MLSAQRLVVSLSVGLSLGAFLAAGCGSSSGGGGSGGAAGTGGATGSGGATGAFTSVPGCTAATDYTTTGTTIMFGGSSAMYTPKCLKVAVGASVTFMGAGSQTFADHPLNPSSTRTPAAGNPITTTMTSDPSKSFTFPKAGFYGYYCGYHDPGDTGNYMSGVIWVE